MFAMSQKEILPLPVETQSVGNFSKWKYGMQYKVAKKWNDFTIFY